MIWNVLLMCKREIIILQRVEEKKKKKRSEKWRKWLKVNSKKSQEGHLCQHKDNEKGLWNVRSIRENGFSNTLGERN